MKVNLCGVCGKEVPIEHTQMMKMEDDNTLTVYHLVCEYAASKLKPCDNCGKHRLVCPNCDKSIAD